MTLTDDIDGTGASETVVFGLDGATFEIDLNQAHADDLREVLEPFVSAARRTGGPAPSRRTPKVPPVKTSDDVDDRAVRAWARENGVEVNGRGRVSTAVLERYRESNH